MRNYPRTRIAESVKPRKRLREDVRARRPLRESRVDIYSSYVDAIYGFSDLQRSMDRFDNYVLKLSDAMEDDLDIRREGTARELDEALSDVHAAIDKLDEAFNHAEISIKRKR